MRNFRELTIWQDSIDLASEVCVITRNFPPEERYALGDQIRRAAVSIPSNIAEGSGRASENDFTHFLDIALGSSYELETQLYIARNLKYIDEAQCKLMTDKNCSIQCRIVAFIQKIRANIQ